MNLDQFHASARTSDRKDSADPLLGNHLKHGVLHGTESVPRTRRHGNHIPRAALPPKIPSPDQQPSANDMEHFFSEMQMDRTHVSGRQAPDREQYPGQPVGVARDHPESSDASVGWPESGEEAHYAVLPRRPPGRLAYRLIEHATLPVLNPTLLERRLRELTAPGVAAVRATIHQWPG